MQSVRTLIQNTARGLVHQPWLELMFPPACVSCQVEIRRDGTGHQGIFEKSEVAVETNRLVIPAIDSHFAFQEWQHLHWCARCWSSLTPTAKSECSRCGAHLTRHNPYSDRCASCFKSDFKFDGAAALGNYGGLLRELVVRMKNSHDEVLAIHLGLMLAYKLLEANWTEFDQLVPIPMHWGRRLKRGFHAAEILAEQVSKVIGVKRNPKIVRAVRATAKQGTLSTTARIENVRNSFACFPRAKIRGQRILIVDDVMTSGSTMNELTRILRLNGAADVRGAILARGGLSH